MIRKDRRGYAVRDWQKLRERSEALDCCVYARAAAALCGLDRFGERQWRARREGYFAPPTGRQSAGPDLSSSARPAPAVGQLKD